MLKLGVVFCILLCAIPAGSAQVSMMYPDETGFGMMQTVEERSMNATAHTEMEGLMENMLEGDMTPAEQDRLVQLMHQYPAGYSTMLNRMTGTDYCGQPGEGDLHDMPYYGWMLVIMPIAMVLGGLFLLVWLLVGVLAIIWLIGLVRKQ